MRVRCIVSHRIDLTLDKIYDVEKIDDYRGWYAITDDSGDSYWYGKKQFEVVDESKRRLRRVKMQVKCIVSHLPDFTFGKIYDCDLVDDKSGCYEVTDDLNVARWYGKKQFKVVG